MTCFRWWPHTRNPDVASFRLRCLQVVEALRASGVDAGLFDEDGSEAPDVLVLSKRYDARTVARATGLRARQGTRLVLDLCDNHFHAKVATAEAVKRADALRAAVLAVDAVVCASDALAAVVREECPAVRQVFVVGDAIEWPWSPSFVSRLANPSPEWHLARLARRLRGLRLPAGGRLVWFGNHGSPNADGGMDDLGRIRDVLHEVHAARGVSLTVISNSEPRFHEVTAGWQMPVFYLAWHQQTFSRALQLHDVALIPVGRNPFTLCKTNNRLATSLAHGLLCVADAIPAYEPFADVAVIDDWSRLRQACDDPGLRAARVAAGQELLRRDWSLERIAGLWATTLGSIHNG